MKVLQSFVGAGLAAVVTLLPRSKSLAAGKTSRAANRRSRGLRVHRVPVRDGLAHRRRHRVKVYDVKRKRKTRRRAPVPPLRCLARPIRCWPVYPSPRRSRTVSRGAAVVITLTVPCPRRRGAKPSWRWSRGSWHGLKATIRSKPHDRRPRMARRAA